MIKMYQALIILIFFLGSSMSGPLWGQNVCYKTFKPRPVFFKKPLVTSPLTGEVFVDAPLTVPSLIEAYRNGIFPWVDNGDHIQWYSPPHRAILEFSDFRINKTTQKIIKNSPYRVSFDENFIGVINASADASRGNQGPTWISKNFINAYIELHKLGYAHSVEVWEGSKLVGGLYGTFIKGVYFGESMFHFKDNTSKIAFVALIEHLKTRGLKWIDTQEMSPLIQSHNSKMISRREFIRRIKKAQLENLTYQ